MRKGKKWIFACYRDSVTVSMTNKNLCGQTMTQLFDMATTRTKRTRPTLGRQTSEQPLDTTLATAAATAGSCHAGNLLNGFGIAFVNRPEDAWGTDLAAVANQSIRGSCPHLTRHVYNSRHFLEAPSSSPELRKMASIFWDWVTFSGNPVHKTVILLRIIAVCSDESYERLPLIGLWF